MNSERLAYSAKEYNICIIAFAILCLSLCSCGSSTKKLLKSDDNEAKYAAAVQAYNDGDYYKADQLFENLILYFRGKDKAEDVNMYYGKSLMGGKQYYEAGYQFENFVRWFPYSPNAQEALFYSAYCKYMESPEYYLDQTLTKESIKAFEDYINKYPNSDSVQAANKYLDELRGKLIQKDYVNAYNYYKVEQYQAAHVALTDFINKYSDNTRFRRDAMYYIILSDYYYAKGSVEERQKERWQTMMMDYERYQALFEGSLDKNKSEYLKKKYEEAKQILNVQ